MKDQKRGLGESNVVRINFPKDFPSSAKMISILKVTFEKSWRIMMDFEDINKWLSNFSGDFYAKEDERRIALWLLCNFTYYGDIEVNHLCSVLFYNFIHKLATDMELSTVSEIEDALKKTVFTSIGSASESGGLMLYHFRQEAKLSIDRFVFPIGSDISRSDIIVCIDDVILSGGTAARFFHKNKDLFSGKKFFYLSLITTKEAAQKLNELNVSVVSCSVLDDRNKVFSEESLCFYKFPQLRNYARDIAEGYGRKIEPSTPLGYKDGQYSFGFFYNIPNNTLPIFWSTQNWAPIFARKEKYQNEKQARRQYGPFV